MAASHPGAQSPARYEIRVDAVLGKRWAAWFEGLQISSDGGQTVICGWLPDQSALHGVLIKARPRTNPDLGPPAGPRRRRRSRYGQHQRHRKAPTVRSEVTTHSTLPQTFTGSRPGRPGRPGRTQPAAPRLSRNM